MAAELTKQQSIVKNLTSGCSCSTIGYCCHYSKQLESWGRLGARTRPRGMFNHFRGCRGGGGGAPTSLTQSQGVGGSCGQPPGSRGGRGVGGYLNIHT